MTVYKSGLPTSAHDQMDMSSYYRTVYDYLDRHKGGMIIDTFSGGGRDIFDLYKRLEGEGRFIAIDIDPLRIRDAVEKSKREEDICLTHVEDQASLQKALQQKEIAIIQGEFPHKPFGDKDINLHNQADFVLCNAGIMFVHPDELSATLTVLAQMLARGGEMILRFSQEREDQKTNEGKTYFIHGPDLVQKILEKLGLNVTRGDDLPDPAGRPFAWIDLQVAKPGG